MSQRKRSKQTPMIVESRLTRPARWFIVTRYREKKGFDAKSLQPMRYMVADEKFDVTDQMKTILKRRK